MNYQTPAAQQHRQFDARTRTRRNWVFAGLGVLAILIVAGVLLLRHPAKPAPPPSIPVNVAKAAAIDLPVSITALGAAQAWTSVTVLAQVSGKLLSVNFAEGTDVKAGQLLAQIDPAPYQAVLTQAQGALKRDQALLANARLDLDRYTNPGRRQRHRRPDGRHAARPGQAGRRHRPDGQGAVAAAQVNLGWCRIVSPIAGRVGVRLVDPGNLVSAGGSVSNTPSTAAATKSSSSTGNGGTGIVIVNQIEPIAVTFTVPEGDFQRCRISPRLSAAAGDQGVQPGNRRAARQRAAQHRRQPRRSRDRHGRTEGALPQRRATSCGRASSSMCS